MTSRRSAAVPSDRASFAHSVWQAALHQNAARSVLTISSVAQSMRTSAAAAAAAGGCGALLQTGLPHLRARARSSHESRNSGPLMGSAVRSMLRTSGAPSRMSLRAVLLCTMAAGGHVRPQHARFQCPRFEPTFMGKIGVITHVRTCYSHHKQQGQDVKIWRNSAGTRTA